MSAFVGIRIAREKLVNNVAKAIENKLTEDEKLQIRFDEQKFRDRYNLELQNFGKGNQAR